MKSFDEAFLLSVWERAADLPRGRRAVAVLSATRPTSGLAHAPVGFIDREILDLRESLFGSILSTRVHCPHCGEAHDCELDIRDVRDNPPRIADATPVARLSVEGANILCRAPTPSDLDAIADLSGQSAIVSLLDRVIIEAERDGLPLPPSNWTDEMIAATSESLQRLDPQAATKLRFDCPACVHAWEEPFDPITYFWNELENWAHALLQDIAALARAYGWTEPEILTLSPRRRRHYLNLLAT